MDVNNNVIDATHSANRQDIITGRNYRQEILNTGIVSLTQNVVISATDYAVEHFVQDNIFESSSKLTIPIGTTGKAIINGVSKVGVASIGSAAYEIYLDYDKYPDLGNLGKATGVNLVALGAGAVAGGIVAASSMPVYAIVVGGVFDGLSSQVRQFV